MIADDHADQRVRDGPTRCIKVRKARKNQFCLASTAMASLPFVYRAARCGGVTRALTKTITPDRREGIQWPVRCSAKTLHRIRYQTSRIRHRNAVNQATTVNDPHAAFRHELECERINSVFDLEHTRGENFLAVALDHADGARAMIGPESISGTTKCTVAP